MSLLVQRGVNVLPAATEALLLFRSCAGTHTGLIRSYASARTSTNQDPPSMQIKFSQLYERA